MIDSSDNFEAPDNLNDVCSFIENCDDDELEAFLVSEFEKERLSDGNATIEGGDEFVDCYVPDSFSTEITDCDMSVLMEELLNDVTN